MKNFIKENWFRIIIVVCAISVVLSMSRIEEEIQMIHKYTAATVDILMYPNK